MAARARTTDRREGALSRRRIVGAAIELLDATGESGLTFRALSAHLKTGAGAIYWHVANKDELLGAATDEVLAHVLVADDRHSTPDEEIRAVACAVFDAVDAHPWIGSQLSGTASPSGMLQIFERLGRQVEALGVPAPAQFDAVSALVNYIIGVARQNAANARSQEPGTNRGDVLGAMAAVWAGLDENDFPFVRRIAPELAGHDDREQFLAGVDLILAGMIALR
ncbi:TetR/AcrR family transcriptional regulator [Kineosporia mesophila]|uniref:TetR/AcrR family transcriptional regulator n=1 Tax=Kineosporia mesophila TaxID=566012 RepID=A0ABP6YZG7_9ACTN|nr:TetR family transcriptional regulator [Kineosporia mesophila]MCD5354261.1 TetR family transcriptional regulator [Kineosporia mesophila]